MHTSLTIRGMHCPACVTRLKDAFTKIPGVHSAHVSLSPPAAHIESSTAIPIESLERAARTAGDYSVSLAQPAPDSTTTPDASAQAPKPSLYPLALIILYISGAAALTTFIRGDRTLHTFLNDFMAAFFLVFSFFKLLDLRGFASAYRAYDFPARYWHPWAFIYPFAELALGIAFLTRFAPTATNAVTLIVMLVSAAGVLKAILDKRTIRCACLGTALNLPMTTITLVEDLGMAAMAAFMLLWRG